MDIPRIAPMSAMRKLQRATDRMGEPQLRAARVRQIGPQWADAALHPRSAVSPYLPKEESWLILQSRHFGVPIDDKMDAMNILISGCSGGGKSTLLDSLHQHGYSVVEEPGRRIVAEELKGCGNALPWVDLLAFADRAIRMAQSDLCAAADLEGIVFFDRGLVDAAVACEFAGGKPYCTTLAGERHYARRVFLAPPWPEIFVTDKERRNRLEDAIAEYSRLELAFSELGYETCELPRVSVADRVNFVLKELRTA